MTPFNQFYSTYIKQLLELCIWIFRKPKLYTGLVVLIALSAGKTVAQDDLGEGERSYVGFANVGLTSPTAASLGKYGSVPVNMATGIPSISIPVTTMKAGSIELPVSLAYHAGGIKVTEYPGEVGLGWSLQAGGVITRVVLGYQDELAIGGWSGYHQHSGSITSRPDFLLKIAQNRIDGEADVYYYNFAGYSGFFVLDGRSGSVSFPDTNIGIRYVGIDNRGVVTFTITTDDGTRYTFSKREYSRKRHDGNDLPSVFPNSVPYPFEVSHATSWYLTSISNPQQQQTIYFTYSSVQNLDHLNNEIRSVGATTFTHKYSNGTSGCVNSIARTTSYSTSIVERFVRLTSVKVFNSSNVNSQPIQELVINYVSDPTNFPIEYRANRILLKKGYQTLKEFDLNYTDDTGAGNLLLLDSVSEKNDVGARLPPYKFRYHLGITQDRQSLNRDYLGYAKNNRSANHLLGRIKLADGGTYGTSRSPSLTHARKGTLYRIDYPTGGFTHFEYELNRARVESIEREIGGLRVKSVTSNAQNPQSDPTVRSYSYGPGNIDGFERVIAEGADIEQNVIYKQRIYEDAGVGTCYLEKGVANPETPLFGPYVTYDSVTEHINGGIGGKRTMMYNSIGYQSRLMYYKHSLPRSELIQKKMDTSGSPDYLTVKSTVTDYTIKSPDTGGYFSNRGSLRAIRPDIQIKVVEGVTSTTYDTTYRNKQGLYKPIWAYPAQTTTQLNASATTITKRIFDPVHKQLTREVRINSTGDSVITRFTYAHEVYPDMIDTIDFFPMLLTQPYSVTVTNGAGEVLQAAWTLWKNYGSGSAPRWLSCGQWQWDGALHQGAPKAPTGCNDQ